MNLRIGTPLALAAGLLALGCSDPAVKYQKRHAAKALEILGSEYRLPGTPAVSLAVRKAKAPAPARFELKLAEPGWRLEAPLEQIAVATEDGPAGTVFTWEMASARVASWGDSGAPVLLHLWRGQDHRPLVIKAGATRGSALEYAGATAMGAFLVVTVPIWAPSALILNPVEDHTWASANHPEAWPLPGPEAPDSYPTLHAPFRSRILADGRGGRLLEITVEEAWAPCVQPPLEAMRQAVGVFQPELAAAVAESPGRPNSFTVPLGPPDQARPLLLLHRHCIPGLAYGELWAFYYPESGAWAKAWRLFPGAWEQSAARPVSP